jgi:hypothetical protein
LGDVLAQTRRRPLPKVPFPQADDFHRVADLVDAVAAGMRTKTEIAERFDFTERHSDYYGNAACFLGLVHRSRATGFEPTLLGHRFATEPWGTRNRRLLETLAGMPVFRQGMVHLLENQFPPGIKLIEEWMVAEANVGGSTVRRRARTVLRWLSWVQNTADCS